VIKSGCACVKRLSIVFCTPEFLNLDIFGAKQFMGCIEPLCTFIGEIRDTKVVSGCFRSSFPSESLQLTLLQIVFRLLRLLFTTLLEVMQARAANSLWRGTRAQAATLVRALAVCGY